MKNQTSRVFALARSADGKLLASGGVNSNFVTIWDLTTLGPPVTTVKNALLAPWALAFVDSGTLVAANANGRVVSIDLVQGSLAAVLVVHELAASALALGRNGLTLWTAGHDYSLSFVDVESAVCKATLCDVNDRLVGSTSGESTEAFLAVDAEGFYNASSGLEDLFRARAAGVLVALTVLRKDFRRPWKIEKALAGV